MLATVITIVAIAFVRPHERLSHTLQKKLDTRKTTPTGRKASRRTVLVPRDGLFEAKRAAFKA